MGKVHVGAAGWLANNTSSWDNPSVNNPAVVEEAPRVIDAYLKNPPVEFIEFIVIAQNQYLQVNIKAIGI